MAARAIKVIGVHAVPEAQEPCHLIEFEIRGKYEDFDWSDVAQEDPKRPRENWQTAWDERVLDTTSNRVRALCFIHYLDTERPILTSFGAVALPTPTERPARLQFVNYDPP